MFFVVAKTIVVTFKLHVGPVKISIININDKAIIAGWHTFMYGMS